MIYAFGNSLPSLSSLRLRSADKQLYLWLPSSGKQCVLRRLETEEKVRKSCVLHRRSVAFDNVEFWWGGGGGGVRREGGSAHMCVCVCVCVCVVNYSTALASCGGAIKGLNSLNKHLLCE